MFKRLEDRWARRWQGGLSPTRIEVTALAEIRGRSRAEVWAFIEPAESAVLINPDIIRAFTVPGTGPGVGLQQCVVIHYHGKEVPRLTTVTAYEEGVFAETTTSTHWPSGGREELQDTAGGTLLSVRFWVEVPGTSRINAEQLRAEQAAYAKQHVARVKELLEGAPPGGLQVAPTGE